MLLVRLLALVLALPLLGVGAAALLWAFLPDAPIGESLRSVVGQGLAAVPEVDQLDQLGNAREIEEFLVGEVARFVPIGLATLLLLFGLWPRSGSKVIAEDEPQDDTMAPVEKGALKKARKEATRLAKAGDLAAAGELLFGFGDLELAAKYYMDGGVFDRAAEIRHDQNRFVESAELYLKAGKHEAAGSIFSQQGEHVRAAECFLEIGSLGVAAEMYEAAEDFRQAADCYRKAEFPRHAAQAFVKCNAWRAAAECLEEVYVEESRKAGGHSDKQKEREVEKLVRQTARLYERADDPEKALSMLERGGCEIQAAELALKLQQPAKAAELFREAGEAVRAAEALRAIGEDREAARLLGEHHRDAGESQVAAKFFIEAGEFMDAAELYREREEYEAAAQCFIKLDNFGQAAEMFQLAGRRDAAAQCFERASRFAEAAECYALLGQPEKEAPLLEQAGQFLKAGESYHREGLDDDAIKVLQQVPAEGPEFQTASALLGDIFRARGQLSLAIQKLRQAIGDRELGRENVPVYYTLATVCEANNSTAEAVDIYEKILALDYHYADVAERLVPAREQLQNQGMPDVSNPHAATSTGVTTGVASERYQVVGELGRGGMGIVYKAKDTVLDRDVAYKVLPGTLEENPQALKNFLREAKAAAKLNHPNIVTVYDAGEQAGRYFIAMEYVDGTTLKEIVRRRGVIPPSGIFHVTAQLCEALEYAHAKSVVHRDIKTANVMWTRDKKVKIMDFGLARVMEEVRNHTTVVSGTPYYMSPEQTLGKNINHRTDLYSLGVTIFEMATGTVPFTEGNIPYHHVHTEPPDIRELQPSLPEALANLVRRCLHKDPDSRYQSAREILIDVKAALAASAKNPG